MMTAVFSVLLFLLFGSTTAMGLSEVDARLQLDKAGVALWPSGSEADPYSPPYSYLKERPDGTFTLYLRDETIQDLSILEGIPISDLHLYALDVRDLTALSRLPLSKLSLACHPDALISLLQGKAIRNLNIATMRVCDLTVLKDMPLEELWFNPYIVTNGMDVVTSNSELDHVLTSSAYDGWQSWSRQAFLAKQQRWGFRADSTGPPPDSSTILAEPISICATTVGGFTLARDWELTVLPDGRLFFVTSEYGDDGKRIHREQGYSLSKDQLQALRRSIVKNTYHTLNPIYGDDLLNASSRTLSIRVGNDQRTVNIRSFHNRLNDNDPELFDAKRLLCIWQTIQAFVTLPNNCLNFKKEDA